MALQDVSANECFTSGGKLHQQKTLRSQYALKQARISSALPLLQPHPKHPEEHNMSTIGTINPIPFLQKQSIQSMLPTPALQNHSKDASELIKWCALHGTLSQSSPPCGLIWFFCCGKSTERALINSRARVYC